MERASFSARRGSEGCGACGDEDAPSEVTQKQLCELHIALVEPEE